jgi:hypothetical protein
MADTKLYEVAESFHDETSNKFYQARGRRTVLAKASDFKKADFERYLDAGYLKPATKQAIAEAEKEAAARAEAEQPYSRPKFKLHKVSPVEAGITAVESSPAADGDEPKI